jgi:hypothetical protein
MLTRLFQRKTQSTSFIPEIDGLRFFAIITVIGYHINTAYARSLGIDDLGMSLMGGERNTFSPAPNPYQIHPMDQVVHVELPILNHTTSYTGSKQQKDPHHVKSMYSSR